MRERALIVAQLSVALAGALLIVAFLTHDGQQGDVRLYHSVAARLAGGEVPYLELRSEYPPLALVPMAVPWFVPGGDPDLAAYTVRFAILNTLLIVATGLLVVWAGARWRPEPLAAVPLFAAYLPFGILLAFVGLWRLDIFPALLSLAGFALVIAARPGAGGVALGASIGAKLYAAPLAPLLAAWALASGGWSPALRHLIGLGAIGLFLVLPFVVLGDEMTMVFLRYQAERGIQIESTWGGLILIGHLVGDLPVTVARAFNAREVFSPWTDEFVRAAEIALPAASALVLGVGLLRVLELARTKRELPTDTLLAYTVALLLTVILANKVFSPQYLVWLLPFAALLPTGPRLLMLAATAITAAEYPFVYPEILRVSPVGVIVLNVRNAALLGTLLWLLYRERPRQPLAILRQRSTGAAS